MKPDPVPFDLRPVRAADLDAVLDLAASSPEAPRWKRSDYLTYLTSTSPLLRTAIVVVSTDALDGKIPDSTILGFAAASLVLDGQQNLCQLDSIAVRPEGRRQGLGSALLRAIFAWSAQNGGLHLSLEVRAGNSAAIRLYEHLGLRPEGRRSRYYADPVEDALILGTPVTRDYHNAVFHQKPS